MSTIESILNETRIFQPSQEFIQQANLSGMQAYQALCAEAELDHQGFWANQDICHIAHPAPAMLPARQQARNVHLDA